MSIAHLNSGSRRDKGDSQSRGTAQQRSRRESGRAKAKQESFAFQAAGRGGARKGAGRKPKGARAGIPHRSRGEHAASHPVQVTTRLRAGLPSLRHGREFVALRRAMEAASARAEFRVVHHSIQSNHLHLIVEAADRPALSMGLRALLVRIARALNRLWRRAGSIFADRFHERALKTPTEVRNSLVYVLQNARKHGIHASGPDPYSSGPWFDGWSGGARFRAALERQRATIEVTARRLWTRITGGERARFVPGPNAGTWLLRIGWQRMGLLEPEENPRPTALGRVRAR